MRERGHVIRIEPGKRPAEAWLFWLLLFAALGLVAYQFASLYSTPTYDSYLWWGDESWLMLEFRTQMATGVFRHPLALGSSLAQANGFVFSNMWLTALLYGLPELILRGQDVVAVGRTVTAVLDLALISTLFGITFRSSGSRVAGVFAVLALITTRSYYLVSHSARYDILGALAVLIAFYFLLYLVRRERPLDSREALVIGAAIAGGLLISVHVPLLLGLSAGILVLMRSAGRAKGLSAFLIGAIAVIGALAIVFTLTHLSASLVGSRSSSFYLNLHDVPALRPFSRSVQIANLEQRAKTFWHLAPTMFCLIGVVFLLVLSFNGQRIRSSFVPWLIILALFASWLLFESSAPTSYLIYILPVFAFLIGRAYVYLPARLVLLPILATGITVWNVMDVVHASEIGREISAANDAAVQRALRVAEQSDAGFGRMLVFNPAVHEAERSALQMMTTHFVEFPGAIQNADSVLLAQHVSWVLLYASPLRPDYMREVGPIASTIAQRVARDSARIAYQKFGYFTDIGRDYFRGSLGAPDTIKLYRLR